MITAYEDSNIGAGSDWDITSSAFYGMVAREFEPGKQAHYITRRRLSKLVAGATPGAADGELVERNALTVASTNVNTRAPQELRGKLQGGRYVSRVDVACLIANSNCTVLTS